MLQIPRIIDQGWNESISFTIRISVHNNGRIYLDNCSKTFMTCFHSNVQYYLTLFAVINCYRCLYKQQLSIYRSFCTLNLVIQSKTLINCYFIAISISPVWFLYLKQIQMFSSRIINRIIGYPFQPYYTTKVTYTYTCVQSLCS